MVAAKVDPLTFKAAVLGPIDAVLVLMIYGV